MTSTRIVLLSFPLWLTLGACGGVTEGSLGGSSPLAAAPDAAIEASTREEASSPPHVDASPTPSNDAATVACSTNAECPEGFLCGWSASYPYCLADTSRTGVCVRPIVSGCEAIAEQTGCDCESNDVHWSSGCGGYPYGYAPGPLLHTGSCSDGAVQAMCTSDSDCASGTRCGYLIDGSCSALGTCLPMSDFGLCNCLGRPACGCDGQTIAMDCCAQAATVPIAHSGACADGGQ